jgi:hypothetical protein
MDTLNDVLSRHTVDQLKALIRCLPDTAPTGKKDELANKIRRSLSGETLRALWGRLDGTQRLALAETLYATDGLFHADRFRAKYGRSPDFSVKENGTRYNYYPQPTALCLFLYYQAVRYSIPVDMREQLRTFVPEPDPVRLQTTAALPATLGENRLVVRNTERDAIVEISLLLRLVDQGKIHVSDKTSLPGTATLRLLTENLVGGDFYLHDPIERHRGQEIGPIKAFAWPLLLQAAGLVQRNGSKLALNPAGVKALTSSPASLIRTIWKKWLKSTLFDEFSRIDVIKGQKSKSHAMSAVAPRRAVISDMLQRCPLDSWVQVDEFSRFMQATDHTFTVTHDPWMLYIKDKEYGSLGYEGFHRWEILQLRYLLCFLFEYAATLGIVDVAYIDPVGARNDFRKLWGVDDLEFLRHYDGLVYFRLTSLGAYCLGMNNDYVPAQIQASATFSVLPSLHVNIVKGHLSLEEGLTLATWATKETDGSWRLDQQKSLAAIEKGHDIAELRAFLQAREDQPLPETVESFIKTCQKQGKALKIAGTALLIDCDSADTAAMIATHKETAGLCLRVGDRQLVVQLGQEEKFRMLIRVLGFGMAY